MPKRKTSDESKKASKVKREASPVEEESSSSGEDDSVGNFRNSGFNGDKLKRDSLGTIIFPDHPEFKPNLTPREVFESGTFGGGYWREIYCTVTKKKWSNVHKKGELAEMFKGIPENLMSRQDYDPKRNKYGVKCGSDLDYWQTHGWIKAQDPYGWVQWYCNFYLGRRSDDDERQISRWNKLAGDKGRFKKQLINRIKANGKKYDDGKTSPVISQVLLHWAYKITSKDLK